MVSTSNMNPYLKQDTKLFPNQVENVQFLTSHPRCLVSDKTGAGKTLSVLAAFSELLSKQKTKTLIVFMPLSAYQKDVWEKDLKKFTNLSCIKLDLLLKNPLLSWSKFDVIICKHTHVRYKEVRELLKSHIQNTPSIICCDEVHVLRNNKSALTQQFRSVSDYSKSFWGLTATTISRNIENLYHIIDAIYPSYLGPWFYFRDTFCISTLKTIGYDRSHHRKLKVTEIVGIKDPKALQMKLKSIVKTGSSFASMHFHYLDYTLSDYENVIYSRIANGITISPAYSPTEWFKKVFSEGMETNTSVTMKDVTRFSNRFIYLQHATDGIISQQGVFNRTGSSKMLKFFECVDSIVSKGQSVIVYFEYLASLSLVEQEAIKRYGSKVRVCLSTGENRLEEGMVTSASVKTRPTIILCTRAASESVSYYFINNVIFFHIPTISSTFTQLVGRIQRKNTLFPGDLHTWIMRATSIDLYKLLVVSYKTSLSELSSGVEELNVPSDYKDINSAELLQTRAKKALLWCKA